MVIKLPGVPVIEVQWWASCGISIRSIREVMWTLVMLMATHSDQSLRRGRDRLAEIVNAIGHGSPRRPANIL